MKASLLLLKMIQTNTEDTDINFYRKLIFFLIFDNHLIIKKVKQVRLQSEAAKLSLHSWLVLVSV